VNQESRSIAEFLKTSAAEGLLARLSDGRAHTHESLAEAMHCRVDHVPGAIALLRSAGLEVRGGAAGPLRLPGGLELLQADRVLEACGSAAEHLSAVNIALGLASTNDALLDQARAGAESGTVCLAEWQGAGRGRQSRRWISPLACSLYLSLLWRFRYRSPESNLGLRIGTASANCLTALGLRELSLKWPNDLQWRQMKLGGILIDGGASAPGFGYAVIGIGLNYRLPTRVRDGIQQPVTTLVDAMSRGCPSRNELAGKLLGQLVSTLQSIDSGEDVDWHRDWMHYDCTRGQRLRVSLPGGNEICGIGAGLRYDGALLVDDGSRIRSVLAGDVSVRVVR
jgi:BirA family biotin operon repressor/biotin-[acetyl-CoA-carboxylase] ligase